MAKRQKTVTRGFNELEAGTPFMQTLTGAVLIKDAQECSVIITGKKAGAIVTDDDLIDTAVIPCDIEVQPSYDVE